MLQGLPIYVSVSVFVFVSMLVMFSVFVSISVCVCVCACVCLPAGLLVCLPVCPFLSVTAFNCVACLFAGWVFEWVGVWLSSGWLAVCALF